jgi:ABC-2 type transport system permease protein
VTGGTLRSAERGVLPGTWAPSSTFRLRHLAKYVAVTRIALRQSSRASLVVVGRSIFFVVTLLIFTRLWHGVAAGGRIAPGIGPSELIWYLAITEWVMLSIPVIYLEIERDVRSGDIACSLTRPISYLGCRFCEVAGQWLFNGFWMGIVGGVSAWWLAGGFPEDPRGLWLAAPLAVLAGVVAILFHATIGVCAIWLQDCTPVAWIWQKVGFVLGGLMVPLDLYPDWLRAIAEWLPFAAILYGPARMAFGLDWDVALQMALTLVLWIGVATCIVSLTYRRALRDLSLNGG